MTASVRRSAAISRAGNGEASYPSKVMITLGGEPENMPTTVLPTPGVQPNKKESDT
jgi:hypothetical protein